MFDLFAPPTEVYYSTELDNFLLLHPGNLFRPETLEGSSGLKLFVSNRVILDLHGIDKDLIYIGEL